MSYVFLWSKKKQYSKYFQLVVKFSRYRFDQRINELYILTNRSNKTTPFRPKQIYIYICGSIDCLRDSNRLQTIRIHKTTEHSYQTPHKATDLFGRTGYKASTQQNRQLLPHTYYIRAIALFAIVPKTARDWANPSAGSVYMNLKRIQVGRIKLVLKYMRSKI